MTVPPPSGAPIAAPPPEGAPYPVPPPEGAPYPIFPPEGAPVVAPPPVGAPAGVTPREGAPAALPPPEGTPYPLPPPEVVGDDEWHRLDPKMLLVTPVKTLAQAILPILVTIIGVSRSDSGWSLYLVPMFAALAVLFGLLPWFTTRYRFTDTQLQVRRGLINRNVLTAPLDRIRSVDLESSVLHRLLGLAKVKIGTGVDQTRIELDSLTKEQSAELRHYLLRRSKAIPTPPPAGYGAAPGGQVAGPAADGRMGGQPDDGQPADGELLARIDWSWLRYAPFSLSGLVIAAGLFGLFAQFNDDLGLVEPERVEAAYEWVLAQAVLLLILAIVAIALIGWVVLSTVNYVVQWWNLRLVREPGGTLRLSRGLFTTRSTTVEEARVRGVRLTEPILLRLVSGAELSTLATGVGTGGTTKVLPPCPRTVAEAVGHTVLQAAGPLAMRLRRHGEAARRRTHVSAQLDLPFVAAGLGALAWWRDWPWWWALAGTLAYALSTAFLAELAYRNLGHELTATHLVSRSGALRRERVVLERAGIIGWVVRQSWFQRRRGLATLVATTAAGPEQVQVVDLPLERAVVLAQAATPGVLDDFLTSAPETHKRGSRP